MKCPLCGLEFDQAKAEAACAAGCRLSKTCDLVTCPNCYYEMVLEPQWYKNLFEGSAKNSLASLIFVQGQ